MNRAHGPGKAVEDNELECDCGANKAVEDMTVQELIESPNECVCSDVFVDSDKKRSGHVGPCRKSVSRELLDTPHGPIPKLPHPHNGRIYENEDLLEHTRLPEGASSSDSTLIEHTRIPVAEKVQATAERSNAVARVVDELIQNLREGYLAYSPAKKNFGSIIIESIVFTIGTGENAVVVGRCNEHGSIVPTSPQFGVSGYIAGRGGFYKITLIKGINLAENMYVSYDYEYDLPVI